MKHRKLIAGIFGVTLTLFTVYAALDTFVLTRVYETVGETASLSATAASASDSAADAASESTAVSGRSRKKSSQTSATQEQTAGAVSLMAVQSTASYDDGNIQITLSTYREYDTTIYVADVELSSVVYLKTAFAQNAYGRNVTATTSDTAELAGAILAINGDYYGVGTGGICIRNGVLYRRVFEENEEVAIIYRNGDMKVFKGESDLDVDREMAAGAWQSFSFGPGLLDERGNLRLDGYQRVNHDPRTLIGMVEPGHYMFVVIDGRQTGYAVGLTYKECADLCWELGMKAAYNLDGGQTSQMTFMGQLVNRPYKNGRSTSDMVIIADLGV